MERLVIPPVEPELVALIDEVAARSLGAADRRGAALAEAVARVSRVYTVERESIDRAADEPAARLRFFLLRDLPKVEWPLHAIDLPRRIEAKETLRVLDLGAGYGTTTMGLARAVRRVPGPRRSLAVTAVDTDARGLELFRAWTAAARTRGVDALAPIELETSQRDVTRAVPRGPFDVVLLGLVLNEVARGDGPAAVLALLDAVTAELAPDGVVIVVEPGERLRSRALQELRALLLARAGAPYVLGPCTHEAACPLLERERDWCHAELPLSLPEALVSVARGAGLRYEGLSFSWLALGRERRAEQAKTLARIVGGPIHQKGHHELHLCHAAGLTRLDWMARDLGRAGLDPALFRGALVSLDRPVEGQRVRHGRDVNVVGS